jgi:hypothetical protein
MLLGSVHSNVHFAHTANRRHDLLLIATLLLVSYVAIALFAAPMMTTTVTMTGSSHDAAPQCILSFTTARRAAW